MNAILPFLQLIKRTMLDKKFRVPRVWSNNELKKFSYLFRGSVVNVSGWKDLDKEGAKYREYFKNASEYWVTNFKSEARGFQGGQDNELYLDLTERFPENFSRFDVVFNHTVMEHIFEVETAFRNLCELSKDLVIIVVPFLQEQHADYGDYWRFTPIAIDKLFKKNGFHTIYINANDHSDASIYVFAIATRYPDSWQEISKHPGNMLNSIYSEQGMIGRRLIKNSLWSTWVNRFANKFARSK
jgi:hypothetical protein